MIDSGTLMQTYGFATLAVLLISLVSLLGIVLVPFLSKTYYSYLILGLIALAIGTMSGDAFLHLLPQAIGLHEHSHTTQEMSTSSLVKTHIDPPHTHLHDHNHDHDHDHSANEFNETIITNNSFISSSETNRAVIKRAASNHNENDSHSHSHAEEELHHDDSKYRDAVWKLLAVLATIFVFHVMELLLHYAQDWFDDRRSGGEDQTAATADGTGKSHGHHVHSHSHHSHGHGHSHHSHGHSHMHSSHGPTADGSGKHHAKHPHLIIPVKAFVNNTNKNNNKKHEIMGLNNELLPISPSAKDDTLLGNGLDNQSEDLSNISKAAKNRIPIVLGTCKKTDREQTKKFLAHQSHKKESHDEFNANTSPSTTININDTKSKKINALPPLNNAISGLNNNNTLYTKLSLWLKDRTNNRHLHQRKHLCTDDQDCSKLNNSSSSSSISSFNAGQRFTAVDGNVPPLNGHKHVGIGIDNRDGNGIIDGLDYRDEKLRLDSTDDHKINHSKYNRRTDDIQLCPHHYLERHENHLDLVRSQCTPNTVENTNTNVRNSPLKTAHENVAFDKSIGSDILINHPHHHQDIDTHNETSGTLSPNNDKKRDEKKKNPTNDMYPIPTQNFNYHSNTNQNDTPILLRVCLKNSHEDLQFNSDTDMDDCNNNNIITGENFKNLDCYSKNYVQKNPNNGNNQCFDAMCHKIQLGIPDRVEHRHHDLKHEHVTCHHKDVMKAAAEIIQAKRKNSRSNRLPGGQNVTYSASFNENCCNPQTLPNNTINVVKGNEKNDTHFHKRPSHHYMTSSSQPCIHENDDIDTDLSSHIMGERVVITNAMEQAIKGSDSQHIPLPVPAEPIVAFAPSINNNNRKRNSQSLLIDSKHVNGIESTVKNNTYDDADDNKLVLSTNVNDINDISSVKAIEKTHNSNINNTNNYRKKSSRWSTLLYSLCGLQSLSLFLIIGDVAHNIVDGIAIGAAFSSSIREGVSTSFAVFCHELPHELGDFAVLISTGMTFRMALIINLVAALTSFLGLYLGLTLASASIAARKWIFAVTAGMFLYVALVDMLPELREIKVGSRAWSLFCQNLGIIIGVGLMLLVALYEHLLF